MDLQAKLKQRNLTLPPVGKPVASYIPAVRSGNVVHVSGQIPTVDGNLVAQGLVPRDVSLEAAQAAAARAALQAVAILDQQLAGDWSRFVRIVRVGVFVAAMAEFDSHHLVANGASELLGELFGEAGQHCRAAVGCASLPRGAAVEVELSAEVR